MSLGSELIRMMRDGPEAHLEALLDTFDASRIVDLMGKTLLHYAALAGNDDITDYLLERGCNPDAQDVEGHTPLMLAIRHKHDAVVRTLLWAKADLELVSRGGSGRSALQMAFQAEDGLCTATIKQILNRLRDECGCRERLLQKLLESGCQLYHAIFLRDAELVRRMLQLGYAVDSRHSTYGYSALHIAASTVDLASVRLLLDQGASATVTDCDGQTPLFYLYNYSAELSDDKLRILRLLLDLRVSLMTQTSRGFYQVGPALSRACRLGIRWLMESGELDFSARDGFDGKTILHYLAMNRNPGVVEELKTHVGRCDVNARDKWGVSPLYSAAEVGNAEALEFLLNNGAEANVSHSTFGFTPLCFAVLEPEIHAPDRDYDRCTELLLQHDADPQVTFLSDANESLTIFDSVPFTGTFGRAKMIVAHLAILECQGVVVEEHIRSKIRANRIFQENFEACGKALRREVFGDVKLFRLLTARDKCVAGYLRDESFLLKLRRIAYKHSTKRRFPYYFSTVQKRVGKLLRRMALEESATRGICRIFQGRLGAGNLVIEEIFNRLDNASLRNLSQL